MTDERKDPPIIETESRSGLSVIDIGDTRVSRGLSRRPVAACKHRRLIYDSRERRICCPDCERDIEGFDAFAIIAEQCHDFHARNVRRAAELDEAERFQARSSAVKELDRIWRSRNMATCCPHCRKGLLTEDMLLGLSSVDVEYERARRGKPRS